MPTIRADQLGQHLGRGLDALYVITGDEPLLVAEAEQAIRTAARAQGYGERQVFTVEAGFDWSQLMADAASLSLFAQRRIVEVRLPGGKPGTQGAQALEAYAARLPAGILTLLTLPRLDKRAAQAPWFVALSRAGTVVDVPPVEREALPRWLAGRLARQGQSADEDTLRFLAEQVEGNLLAAHQEIQKLGLLYPPRHLGFDEVSEAVLDVARFDVFHLVDAMLAQDVARVARILDALAAAGEKPVPVLGVLVWAIRGLTRARHALDQGMEPNAALREAGFWGERQARVRRLLPKLSAAQLAATLGEAADVDRMSKGLMPGDVWDALLKLCLRIAHPA